MLTYTFNNITITIKAENAKEAYETLADMLDQSEVFAWNSDTYTDNTGKTESTDELM